MHPLKHQETARRQARARRLRAPRGVRAGGRALPDGGQGVRVAQRLVLQADVRRGQGGPRGPHAAAHAGALRPQAAAADRVDQLGSVIIWVWSLSSGRAGSYPLGGRWASHPGTKHSPALLRASSRLERSETRDSSTCTGSQTRGLCTRTGSSCSL